MKKIALILAVMFAFGVAGCGEKKDGEKKEETKKETKEEKKEEKK
jgi:outer membrane lipoprotein SlyB